MSFVLFSFASVVLIIVHVFDVYHRSYVPPYPHFVGIVVWVYACACVCVYACVHVCICVCVCLCLCLLWIALSPFFSGNCAIKKCFIITIIITKSGISVCELISTLKNKKKNNKKAQEENKWLNILPKSSQARIKPPPLCLQRKVCISKHDSFHLPPNWLTFTVTLWCLLGKHGASSIATICAVGVLVWQGHILIEVIGAVVTHTSWGNCLTGFTDSCKTI